MASESETGGWAREVAREGTPTLKRTLDVWKALFNRAIDAEATARCGSEPGYELGFEHGRCSALLEACKLIEEAIGPRYAQPLTSTREHIVAGWNK